MLWKAIIAVFLLLAVTAIIFSQKLTLIQPTKIQSLGFVPPVTKPENNFTPNLLSLEKIFSNDHSWVATLSAQNLRTIVATGDIIPARSVNFQSISRKDFTWPYLKTADVTKNADITFANLEAPLLTKCPVTQEGMVFCGDSRNVEGLVFASVDIVSLANNHAANHGASGVNDTVKLLNDHGILTTGLNSPIIKEVRGIKFAFLGYNDISKPQPGISNVVKETIQKEIHEAKKQAHVVIVTFHWGTEYRNQPDQRQIDLGHLAIDSGADLIIGNHPHWIQPIEIYKGKLITYAHGNFVFDQMWSQKTREGIIGRYTFFDKNLIDVEYLPVQIDDFGQPFFLDGTKKEVILNDMKIQSIKLSARP